MQQRNSDYFLLNYPLLLLLLHCIKMNICCVAEDLRCFWPVTIRWAWQRFICWWTWTTATRSTVCTLSIIQAWQTDTSLWWGTWGLDTSRCGTWWVRGFILRCGTWWGRQRGIWWGLPYHDVEPDKRGTSCRDLAPSERFISRRGTWWWLHNAVWKLLRATQRNVEIVEGFTTKCGICWGLHIVVWNLLRAPPHCDVEPGKVAVPYHDVEPRNWGWVCIAMWNPLIEGLYRVLQPGNITVDCLYGFISDSLKDLKKIKCILVILRCSGRMHFCGARHRVTE